MSDLDTLSRLTVEDVEAAICDREPSHYRDRHDWAHDCHSVSLAIVRSDLFEEARVARGACRGVGGQHSWVVLGRDCYDPAAPILDATLWSYDPSRPVLWKGTLGDGLHTPHGAGRVWDAPRPRHHGGDTVGLDPAVRGRLSYAAAYFVRQLEPLDRRGWAEVGNLPVGGWPAAEVLEAMRASGLGAYVPIDRLGMLTDLNPDGLYLKEKTDA